LAVAPEDPRTAASLVTTLSGLVITATLAVIGAQAVIATFVIDRRDNLTAFYVVSGVGLLALVLSVIVGGKGIYEIIEGGAGGDWKISTKRRKFEIQSLLALGGAMLVVASAFLGDPKEAAESIRMFAAMLTS
jgi:hypothetical protein